MRLFCLTYPKLVGDLLIGPISQFLNPPAAAMADQRRNAIITGAASGLGRAIALRLARDGWNIAVCDINDARGTAVAEEVKAAGGDASFEHLDVTDIEQWQQLSQRLRDRWQSLDLLVNNAGVAAGGNVGEAPLDDWRWIIDINLYNGIYGCHTFVDWLKANPRVRTSSTPHRWRRLGSRRRWQRTT